MVTAMWYLRNAQFVVRIRINQLIMFQFVRYSTQSLDEVSITVPFLLTGNCTMEVIPFTNVIRAVVMVRGSHSRIEWNETDPSLKEIHRKV